MTAPARARSRAIARETARFRRPVRRLALPWLLGTVALGILAPTSPMAAQNLLITTPYPSISVQPGATASFDLAVRADAPIRVDISVEGAPDDWASTLRGGGREVSSVFADPDEPPELTLDLDVPEDAQPGSTTITVVGTAGREESRLALEVVVVTGEGGEVAMSTDVPARQGTAEDTLTYSVDLQNETPQQLTFELQAVGPRGWTVSVEPQGEADATSVTVDARGSQALTVEAVPPPQATEGDYVIRVDAVAGDQAVSTELLARITGVVEMTFTTPDQRLNATVTTGSSTSVDVSIVNSGTATLNCLTLTGTGPSDWEITFEPSEITSVAPGDTAAAAATIVPSGNAVAGDYVVTLTASGEGVEETLDIRVTVETSPLWGLVGLGLIALTLGAMVWVFRRYGRR
jgi:uncharacterized membrane protein